jgi:hypothetical protein
MPTHTVKPGDCLNSIAKEHGFFNYQTVYKHGGNKKSWPNPNTLEEGKTVDVPDKKPKKAKLALDKDTPFVLDRRKTKLRIVLLDAELKPLKVVACKTQVGVTLTVLPNGKGLVELANIDPLLKGGTISAKLPVPPPPAGTPAPPAAPDPKAYPIKIAEAQFLDKNPDPAAQANLEWTLRVGHLEAHTTIRGVTQRMHNLGFNTPIVKAENDQTKAAVNAYQVGLKLKKRGSETGKIDDVRKDVRQRHDTP